jgi:hypothetical protein
MLGVKSLKTETPIMKPWRVDSTNVSMVETMSRFRCDLTHEHAPCAGQDTVLTGFYPVKMAEIIVQTIVEDCANSIKHQVTTVADLYDVPSPENETVSTKRPQSSETNLADKTSFVAEHPSHNDGYDMDENAVEQGGVSHFRQADFRQSSSCPKDPDGSRHRRLSEGVD